MLHNKFKHPITETKTPVLYLLEYAQSCQNFIPHYQFKRYPHKNYSEQYKARLRRTISPKRTCSTVSNNLL